MHCTDWHSWLWWLQSADSDRQSCSQVWFPCFGGIKQQKQSRSTDLFLLPPSLALTCIYSLMMSVKCSHECMKKKISEWWWWSCSVKSDLYIQRELGLAVMMLLPEGLHSSTLTTRGRVIKQSHKEHSEEDVSIILNELNYYFWTIVNWTLIVLLLHLFAFVLFVWNHSFFVVLV